jgi:hypothetical protein
VIVASEAPSDGICGLEVSSVNVPTVTGPPGWLPPPPPDSVSSLPPLQAQSTAATAVNKKSFSLCISLIL